jgi:hypothetical protein
MKVSALCLCAVVVGVLAQDRSKKTTAADLPKVLAQASKALDAKRYGACQRELKTALGLVAGLVRTQVLATMPPAPAGFTAAEDQPQESGDNALAAAMGLMSLPIEKTYHKESGEQIRVSVTADSPMVGVMGMMFQAAAMSKEGELVNYKDNKALLKKEGDNYNLQIVVSGRHLISVDASGIDDEKLLQFADQAFVDRVVGVLDG